MQSRMLEAKVKVRNLGVAYCDLVLTSALDSACTNETTEEWCKGRGAHGNRGSIRGTASDKDDGPIAPCAHARKDGVCDIYGPNEVRVHVIHYSFGAKNLSVNVPLPTRR